MKKNLFFILLTFSSFWGNGQTLTLQPGATGKDTRIWSKPDMVNSNAGNSEYLPANAWTWDDVFGTMHTLIDFDLSSLPAGATITDAKLSLYHYPATMNMANGDNALYIKRITSSWDELTVTWNNKPTTTETNKVSVPAFATGNNVEDLDVTTLVTDMVADPTNSHGFLIMMQTEQTYRSFNMASSEYSNASLHPKLVITYTLASGCVTLQPGATGKDTRIWSKPDMVNNNAGTSVYLPANAWTWDDVFGTMHTLIDFDLTSLPSGAVVTDANLSLYHYPEAINMANGDNALYIKRITSSWDELTVTWNNKPTTTETNKVSVPAFATGNNVEDLDVTTLVTDMVADLSNSHGFLIMMQTEQTYRSFNMASSEYSNAALHPKLEVCYTVVNGLSFDALPKDNELDLRIYPNPYSDHSVINFNLPSDENTLIELISSDGKIIKTLANGYFFKGTHDVSLNLEKSICPPGLYLVRVLAGEKVYTQKLIVK